MISDQLVWPHNHPVENGGPSDSESDNYQKSGNGVISCLLAHTELDRLLLDLFVGQLGLYSDWLVPLARLLSPQQPIVERQCG